MGIRDSISKPFKKLKNRLVEGIRKRREGGDGSREGRGINVEGSESGQISRPHPEIEDVAESGPSRKEGDGKGKKAVQVNPPTSTPSISHIDSGKPNSM